ncbi:hypothetical protein [Halopiger xanaduensis]|uniref:DUF8048 domain-containing protein n=1 Tax=Halopiger xanaduensis (strain DSM 18323 / JCM 14033 / SH-6) TaxID=797210 RepID=F8D807_HALXS|nr:hypothetical protein [Halopiger xanaduensis]AEH37899.1 hypothetical protein Halxa_3287 [Halopiger xanaduensis SH-6]
MKITHQEVEFDEFSRVCDLVEEYFGETLDDVALHAPVSRRQLVAVLARAQLSGRRLANDGDGLADAGDVVYQSNRETLYWLDGDFWTDVCGRHHLEPDEGRAAREVHRRILEAIDGDVSHYNRERDPFVLIERFGLYE